MKKNVVVRVHIRPMVIVRSKDAGVHYGRLVSRRGSVVELSESRRIWYWKGAKTLSDLSINGPKNPAECKFGPALKYHTVLGVCEIIVCESVACKVIEGVTPWVE